MRSTLQARVCTIGLASAILAPLAAGQSMVQPDVQAQLAELQRQLAHQRALIDELRAALAVREGDAIRSAVTVLGPSERGADGARPTVEPQDSAPLPLASAGAAPTSRAPDTQPVGPAKPRQGPAPAKPAPHPPSKKPAPRPVTPPGSESARMLAVLPPLQIAPAHTAGTQAHHSAENGTHTAPHDGSLPGPGSDPGLPSAGSAARELSATELAVLAGGSAGAGAVMPGQSALEASIARAEGANTGQTATAGTGDAATPRPGGPVGRPPAASGRPPEVAPLFEQPGVLTPRGKMVFEPALQFGYSSSNRVALVGYTIIPALLIGLVDVREVKRNTATAILSGRIGLTNRLEVEARLPYVYRSDATVSREIFTGTAVENVFSTSGKHIGDAEVGLRYQLNRGGVDSAFYVGSLRVKSRTGRDPFSVVTDCARRCIGPNASGTGLPLELPTGSGFYSVQPGLTWLFPSDPAVFFGSLSYLHNIHRKNVSRVVLGGEREFLGEVDPGDVIGFNFGMGLGLNEKSSLSLGYDHSSIGRTKQAGLPVPGSVRTQLGTLLLGFSYRMSERRSINVSVGAGLTRDTPDVSLTVRMPTTF